MRTFIAFLFIAGRLAAADINLAWDSSPDAEFISGTRLDVRTFSGSLYIGVMLPKGQTNITIVLPAGLYQTTLVSLGSTAWTTNDLTGEVSTRDLVTDSAPSNVILISVPKDEPVSTIEGPPSNPVNILVPESGTLRQDKPLPIE